MRHFAIAACLGALAALSTVGVAVAQGQQEITSAGPLTRVIVSDVLNCQVAYRGDENLEIFGGEQGSCGTFLFLDGTLYGTPTTPAPAIGWTPVSQTGPTGSGSSGDPFRIVTVVDIADLGIRVEQTDTYIVGAQSYRTDIRVTNNGPVAHTGAVYRGGDCYLQENDEGYGRVDSGAPACIVDPKVSPRIEQWLPITPGSHFMEAEYGDVFQAIATGQQLPDTCVCDQQVDNGAGLSWPISIAAGQTQVFSHETFFSPFGRAGVAKPFESSVPDPTQISLDPVIVVQSVAIAAGVILLVPFPSALFNSTLEENYGEVMGFLGRVTASFARLWAGIWLWIRRRIDQRRAASAAPPSTAAPPRPEPVAAGPRPRPRPPAPPVAPASSGALVARRPLPPPPAPPTQDLWRKPQGMVIFVLASALLYAFLDPTFGFSVRSIAEFLGLAAGLFMVLLAYGVPLVSYARRHGLSLRIRALPATLLVALLCVFISRFTNFQPGYLYGLIVAFLFAGVTMDEEGPARALAAGVSLGVAAIAWVALALIRGTGVASDEFSGTFIATATVTVVVAGVENSVFALLPLRFMAGSAVFNWNRRVWVVLLGLGVLAFVHVLLNPTAGYLADSTRTSFFTLIALLIAFGVASVLFWGYFRFRPQPAGHEGHGPGGAH